MAGASEKETESEREKGVPSSRSLHNFRMPSPLKWGHQKHLRCINVSHDPCRSPTSSNSVLNSTAPPVDLYLERAISSIPVPQKSLAAAPRKNVKAKSLLSTSTPVAAVSVGDTTGIGAVREKLTSDLKISADQLKLQILEDKEKDSNNNEKKPSEEELPWNLRTRRPSGKASNEGGNVGSLPLYRQERGLKSLLASDKGEGSGIGDQQRPRFSFILSKGEIETDFLLMTGAKPPRRPKRRTKPVQKQFDALFPGSWLTDATSETYKVPDLVNRRVRSEGDLGKL